MVTWNSCPRDKWELFHKKYNGSLQQAWAYGEALTALGVRIDRACAWDGERLLGVAQFMTRRIAGYLSLSSCTRGPVWSADTPAALRAQAWREMRRAIPTRPLRVTLVSPDLPAGEQADAETAGLWRVMTGYSTVLLDLRRPLPELRADLDGKWRNRLAKAEADAGLAVRVEPNLPECQRLLERETQQRAEKRFHGLPTKFVPAYIEACGSRERAFAVSFAQARKETQAAMLFLVHGSVATYHLGWASEAGRKANAHNLLLWRGIEHLKKQGLERLDLGGINTRALPGISRFKLGAGGQPLTLAGTYY
ncbi:lipid II:glycine glycyltransferase FemX [Ramlibacter sp. MAHUQ-53]|uniref:lipid II:glycine glycyltransferase FemX n=1 Tax=unclassified Ramlibacter TaxID=2617605 RepID=UPI00362C68A4